jgi:hypothetical protein
MTTTLGILLAIAATYWVFTDSRAQGREIGLTVLWAFGVLLLPIVFLPLYFFFGRKNKPSSVPPPEIPSNSADIKDETAGVNAVKCPMCTNENREDAEICRACGYTLKPLCSNCEKRLDRTWTVCPACQTPAKEK